MSLTIALVGNPNSGKTTLFNELTGARQYVGNWPGVTVERKEGPLKHNKEVTLQDLPGVYSLSPYTQEEVITRDYLTRESPAAIINIVDGSNIERNLYLTTQLLELGIPLVVAVNMMDVVEKAGDTIDFGRLSDALGVPVLPLSALKGEGAMAVADMAISVANSKLNRGDPHVFTGAVEHALAHIEEALTHWDNGSTHHHHAGGVVHPGAMVAEGRLRWFAVKLFEGDEKVLASLNLDQKTRARIQEAVLECEALLEDDAESIITDQRYQYIRELVAEAVRKKPRKDGLLPSDRIDRVVTSRILGFPIFIAVMFLVYFISVTTIGSFVTDWTNEGLFGDGFFLLGRGKAAFEEATEAYETAVAQREAFIAAAREQGLDPESPDFASLAQALVAQRPLRASDGSPEGTEEVTFSIYQAALAAEEPAPQAYGPWVRGIPALVEGWMESGNVADWLRQLVVEGIIGGVGAVLGFVPQMFVLFFFLAILEDIGYMARVAFIMDRIFRRFGLSGKSFIPMLIGSGCSVPGIMASRTIENLRDRRMTIITTSFIPCGAKIPVVALVAGALFAGSWWVAPLAYFLGVGAVITSGIILKKTRLFAGTASPFVMELPAYHLPKPKNVLGSMWERGFSFIKRAGTVILLAAVVLWFLKAYGVVEGRLQMVEDMDHSILAFLGGLIAPLFRPLGFGTWQSSVATTMGLVAKEEVVSVFGVLYGVGEGALDFVEAGNFDRLAPIAAHFTALSGFSFLTFNLLCAPCFAAIGAIRREMNSARWTLFAVSYLMVFAYGVSFILFQLGSMFTTGFAPVQLLAVALLAGLIYLIFRKNPHENLRAKGALVS